MLSKYSFFSILALLLSLGAFAQDSYVISGKIADSLNSHSLGGASVRIKGTSSGTVARDDGSFQLKTAKKFPIVLVISSIGYKSQEFVVDETAVANGLSLSLNTQQVLVDQVVVTASRVSESILRSPVTIEKLDLRAIKESPAPSFYDALENVKGVQMTTQSLG